MRRWVAPLAVVVLALSAASPSSATTPSLGVSVGARVTADDLERIAAGGAETVRVPVRVPRGGLGAGREASLWLVPDRLVSEAIAAGLDVVIALELGRPARLGCGTRCSTEQGRALRARLRRFVGEAAHRYSRTVRGAGSSAPITWQIEGSLRKGRLVPAARGFRRILAVATAAIARRSPGSRMLLGGLRSRAGRRHHPPHRVAAAVLGPGAAVDGLVLEAGRRKPRALRDDVDKLRRGLDRLGADELWLDVGWSSRGARGAQRQRQRLRAAHRLAVGRSDGLLWRRWRDSATGSGVGLVDSDRRGKPSWREFRRLARGGSAPDEEPPAPPGEQSPGGRPPQQSPPAEPVPTAPGKGGDPRDFTVGVSPAAPISELDARLMADAGVDLVRFPLSWRQVQGRLGAPFDWRQVDRVFDLLSGAGITPLPMLWGSPPLEAGGDANLPPVGSSPALDGWSEFVSAAVERYGSGGEFWRSGMARSVPTQWQIWNEPNAPAFWGGRPSPAEYLRLLAVSAAAIRAADPEAEVLLAGMYGSPRHPRSIAAATFLGALYAIPNASRWFDAVAAHPYAGDLPGVAEQLRRLRAEIESAGDAETELWVTELGWGSVPDPRPLWAPLTPGPGPQAELLAATGRLLAAREEAWNLGGLVWYSWRDPTTAAVCPFCGSAGLLRSGYQPKPALAAFSALAG